MSGGSTGEVHSIKVAAVLADSLKTGTPFIFINDSGGARVQEGIDSLSGYGKIFFHQRPAQWRRAADHHHRGTDCAGGAVYSPALTDFVIQTRAARMFITGPQRHPAGDRRSGHRRSARRRRTRTWRHPAWCTSSPRTTSTPCSSRRSC